MFCYRSIVATHIDTIPPVKSWYNMVKRNALCFRRHCCNPCWIKKKQSAELCPCPSCVLGRTAAERARLCSKIPFKPTRPGQPRLGTGSGLPSNAGTSAAARHRRSKVHVTGNKVSRASSCSVNPAFEAIQVYSKEIDADGKILPHQLEKGSAAHIIMWGTVVHHTDVSCHGTSPIVLHTL